MDIEEIGFSRPCTEQLSATVDPYKVHIFYCTGTHNWPSSTSQFGPKFSAFHDSLKSQPNPRDFKLGLCSAVPTSPEEMSVLVFSKPSEYMVRITFTEELIEQFWKFIHNQKHHGLNIEHLSKQNYIFVCTHTERDARCGYCGPIIANEFKKEIENQKLSIDVYSTSHVGKHKFAADLIVFPSGDWYGYVKPTDVPRILDVLKNPNIKPYEELVDLWRGAINLTKEQQTSLSQKGTQKTKSLTRRRKIEYDPKSLENKVDTPEKLLTYLVIILAILVWFSFYS